MCVYIARADCVYDFCFLFCIYLMSEEGNDRCHSREQEEGECNMDKKQRCAISVSRCVTTSNPRYNIGFPPMTGPSALLNYHVIFLARSAVAALARLLASVIAPLTTQLGEVIQPLAIRFRRHVVPQFLFDALTRSRTRTTRGTPDGSYTNAINIAIRASYVTLAITRRYARAPSLTDARAFPTRQYCELGIPFTSDTRITKQRIFAQKKKNRFQCAILSYVYLLNVLFFSLSLSFFLCV